MNALKPSLYLLTTTLTFALGLYLMNEAYKHSLGHAYATGTLFGLAVLILTLKTITTTINELRRN